jgi:hypothetical protein
MMSPYGENKQFLPSVTFLGRRGSRPFILPNKSERGLMGKDFRDIDYYFTRRKERKTI